MSEKLRARLLGTSLLLFLPALFVLPCTRPIEVALWLWGGLVTVTILGRLSGWSWPELIVWEGLMALILAIGIPLVQSAREREAQRQQRERQGQTARDVDESPLPDARPD